MSTKENNSTNTGESEKSTDQQIDELDVPEDDVDLGLLMTLGTDVSRETRPGQRAARLAAFNKVLARGKPKSE